MARGQIRSGTCHACGVNVSSTCSLPSCKRAGWLEPEYAYHLVRGLSVRLSPSCCFNSALRCLRRGPRCCMMVAASRCLSLSQRASGNNRRLAVFNQRFIGFTVRRSFGTARCMLQFGVFRRYTANGQSSWSFGTLRPCVATTMMYPSVR